MKNNLFLKLIVVLLINFLGYSQSWVNRPNLPSTSRSAVGSFNIGSKGYFIGGETAAATNLVDTWEYNTETNSWSQKADYPGVGTQKGAAFSINGIGYYGLGTAGGQLYSYNSQNNTWTQKATCAIPSVSFWSTTYFVIGTKAYFLDQNKKFFFYDSTTDSWTLLSDFTGTKRVTGVGFAINNKGYICTGLNATSAGNSFLNDLWEYNPINNTWTQKTALPSAGRYASFGFAFNNKGYVLGGERNSGVMLNEFWEYNPISDSWSTLPNYIGGSRNYLSGFVTNNSVYAGFGSPGFGVSINEYGFFNQSSSFCSSLSGSLSNGLMGYWPFCGNANDYSGNDNHGTVNGATLTTDRFGNNNSSYNFINNSNGQNIMTPLVPPTGLNSRSLSLWFQQSQSNISGNVWTMNGWGNNSPGMSFVSIIKSDKIGVDTSNSYITYESSTLGSWHHLVLVYDISNGNTTSSIKVYLDGNLLNVISNSFNPNTIINTGSLTNFFIGSISSNQFIGKIDDVGVWNRALTSQEVTQLFNQNQCITNVTVTDTLIINVGQLSFENPILYANNISIFPNPASTQININFNNISDLSGGTIKVINSLGQQVATTPITATGTNSTMSLNTWGGSGLYFVQILNPQGQIVDIKKIILQ